MRLSTNTGVYSGRPGKLPRYDMIEETIDRIADAGFEVADVNFCATIYGVWETKKSHEPILDGTPEERHERIARLAAKCAERGIVPNTTHIPFFRYDTELEHLDGYMDYVYRALDASAQLGAKWAVMHLSRAENCVENTVEFARPLCRYATERGVGIAIENMAQVDPQNLCAAIDRLAAEGYLVGACFDVGHSHLHGEDPAATVRLLGSRIKVLHVHDNSAERDNHDLPYTGKINWDAFLAALAEVGYEGDFNYELNATRLPDDPGVRAAYLAYSAALARYFVSRFEAEKEKLRAQNA